LFAVVKRHEASRGLVLNKYALPAAGSSFGDASRHALRATHASETRSNHGPARVIRRSPNKSGAKGAAKNPGWQEEERLGRKPYRETYKGNPNKLHKPNVDQ
jgi:hypothetical protein